jgi:hypothetical protein
MTKIDITGIYRKDGNNFFNTVHPFKLVKANRLPTNNKTQEFLVLKPCCDNPILPDGSKQRYVSGIFWKTNHTFRIDFDGIRYNVQVTSDGFIVTAEGGKGL